MYKRLIRLVALFVLGSALGVSSASAARLSAYEVGAFAGYAFGDSSAGVQDDLVYGLRANVTVGKVQQFEFVADRVDTQFDSFSFGRLDETFTSYAARWVFNYPAPQSKTIPYFFIGIGRIEDEIETPSDPMNPNSPLITVKDDDTFYPVGGGFRRFVSNRVGIRVEGRLKGYSTFGVSQDAWDVTVGLTFHLGPPR